MAPLKVRITIYISGYYNTHLAIVIVVRVLPFPDEVRGRRPDDVRTLRRRRRQQGRPLQADGQGQRRGGAEARGPPALVDGSVPYRS